MSYWDSCIQTGLDTDSLALSIPVLLRFPFVFGFMFGNMCGYMYGNRCTRALIAVLPISEPSTVPYHNHHHADITRTTPSRTTLHVPRTHYHQTPPYAIP